MKVEYRKGRLEEVFNNENGTVSDINFNEEDVKNHQGINAWIINDDGKVLTMWHNKFGFWTIPMGKVKDDETPTDALKVEMWEELGIEVKKCKKIMSFEKTYFRKLQGATEKSKVHTIQTSYHLTKYTGEIYNKEPQKHREIKWIDIEELMSLTNISDAISKTRNKFYIYYNSLNNQQK